MKYSSFTSPKQSHEHSLQILDLMYEYDDFMESVGTVVDLGSGNKLLDLEWWTTRTTRDEQPMPLGIKGTAVDLNVPDRQIKNVTFSKVDIQSFNRVKRPFDVLWCHDTLQYLESPYQALSSWRGIASKDAMLVISVPQTTNIKFNIQEFNLPPGHLYHYTMISLIYLLAVNGWDCASGFFKKEINDNWLHAIVYKSEIEPLAPGTSWYELSETGLLPETAEKSILNHGFIRQQDLVIPWLDKSNTWMGQQ